MRIDPPENVERPLCHCPAPCAMVQAMLQPEQTDYEDDVTVLLWVCDLEQCMFSVVHAIHSVSERNAASIMTTYADSFADYAQEAARAPEEEGTESAEAFWASLGDKMMRLNDEQVELLCPANILDLAPVCDCGETCSLAQCLLSSDIFWVCAGKTCKFVWLEQSVGKTTSFDIGEDSVLGDFTIDRFTTPAYLMRWCGYSLTRKFFFKLQGSNLGENQFPKGSYQIEPGQEYDSFISYRGATGSILLWLTLCGELQKMLTFL